MRRWLALIACVGLLVIASVAVAHTTRSDPGFSSFFFGHDHVDNAYMDDRTDYVYGEGSGDHLEEQADPGLVEGGGGSDDVWGASGADELRGELGNDYVKGGDGFDDIWAGGDNDVVEGGGGDDDIWSHDADPDNIDGGPGQDTCDVDGQDTYVSCSAY